MSSRQLKSGKKLCASPSVEEYYKNKYFSMPKEKTWETIFEEPKVSKSGSKQFTSMKKFKRYLQFDDQPSNQKLRKRRKRAKKYAKNFFNLDDRSETDPKDKIEKSFLEEIDDDDSDTVISLAATQQSNNSELRPVNELNSKNNETVNISEKESVCPPKIVCSVKKRSVSKVRSDVLKNISDSEKCNCDSEAQEVASNELQFDKTFNMDDAKVLPESLFL